MLLFYRGLIGLTGSLLLGLLAYLSGKLTKSGFVVLLLIGTASFIWAPPIHWLLLLLFFGSSWLIATVKKYTATRPTPETTGKSDRRDCYQLVANSLPYLLAIIAWQWTKEIRWWLVAAAAIAGATSDTWASEIGVLSKKPPRNILGGKPTVTGESGGISVLGLAASLAGSLLISGTFMIISKLFAPGEVTLSWLWIPLFTGSLNSLLDSLLGSSLQGKFLTKDQQLVEQANWHDQPATHVSGLKWFNNDGVNLISGLATILLAWWLTTR